MQSVRHLRKDGTTRWRIGALTVAAVILAAACGSSSPSASEPPGSPTSTAVGASPSGNASAVRQLTGKVTVGTTASVASEGAEPTAWQTAWAASIAEYKRLQPGVEVELIDVPGEPEGEAFCQANTAAKSMPDISLMDECSGFRPTAEEVANGTSIAIDFKPFEDEVSPYTGKPWREDWASDYWRTSRCTEFGAIDSWTCQPGSMFQFAVWVNLDILKEYGYDDIPSTYAELFALSDKINADGKYLAWDNAASVLNAYAGVAFTSLTMDRWQAAGGDPADIQGSARVLAAQPGATVSWCNGTYTSANNPSIQEALKLEKRFLDTSPGGAAGFLDPSRDTTGRAWLTGKAAFRYDASFFYSNVKAAEAEGVLNVSNWAPRPFPVLVNGDLEDKSIAIAFDGEPFLPGGGRGDNFAPKPEVRKSGVDENVDLIVRDFFQFLSSPTGQQRYVATNQLPANPSVPVDDALRQFLDIRAEVFEGVTQPPGGRVGVPLVSDREIQGWMQGVGDFTSALNAADENIRRAQVQSLEDNLSAAGLTELPTECAPWKTQ